MEAIHRFIWDKACDFPDFEEASRSYFTKNYNSFEKLIMDWPEDIKQYLNQQIIILVELEKISQQEKSSKS